MINFFMIFSLLNVQVLSRLLLGDRLAVSVADVISNEPIMILNQVSNQGAQGHIENFYTDQKDLFEKLLQSKDSEIQSLKEII